MDERAPIRAVVFDFGGVVQRPAQTSRHVLVARQLHLDPAVVAQHLKRAQGPLKRGEIDEAAFWRAFAAEHGGRVDDDAAFANALAAHYLAPGVCHEVLAVAQKLCRLGVQTPLCSNTVSSRVVLNDKRGAYAPFWPRLLSCEVGAVKPEPKMFAALVAQTKLPPGAHVLVDDKAANVAAAEAFGMRGHVYTGVAQLVAALRDAGLAV